MAPQRQTPQARGSRRVAMLVDTSTSWGRRILKGINDYTRLHEPWHIFVEARGLEERLRVPRGWRGDGVIARVGNNQMAAELRALGVPVVNVSGIRLPGEPFPCVMSDLPAAAALAANHLLERGFHHFAYFSLTGLPYVQVQRNAYVETLRKKGFDCAVYSVMPRNGAELDWNLDLAPVVEWLKGLPKPVGILTWNPSSSRELIYACQEAGLLVPEEVGVISGSDDDVLCELLHIPLSAIHVAAEQIGQRAAELLDHLMDGGTAPAEPTLIAPLRMVTRQSTDTLAIRDPALVKALQFIRKNASRPIHVSQVAREAGVSRRALERRFIQFLGRSPATEIRRVHIEHAKELLEDSELTVPQVAEAAGFGSPEYLAYVFRIEVGQTPLKFRKSVRGSA